MSGNASCRGLAARVDRQERRIGSGRRLAAFDGTRGMDSVPPPLAATPAAASPGTLGASAIVARTRRGADPGAASRLRRRLPKEVASDTLATFITGRASLAQPMLSATGLAALVPGLVVGGPAYSPPTRAHHSPLGMRITNLDRRLLFPA